MIRTLGITKERQVITDFSLEEVKQDKYEYYWVDIGEPTKEEEALLSTFFGFHPLAIEDCLLMLQRPKLDYYEGHTFFVLHTFDDNSLQAEELNLFIGKDFIVTFHIPPMHELEEARKRIMQEHKGWDLDAVHMAYHIIDQVVDAYFPIVYRIEDYLNEVEDNLTLDMKHLSLDQVFDLRSDLLRLRRTIVPMRDLLYRVISSERISLSPTEKAYFTDIYDHLLKLVEIVEANRELTADIRDSHASINSSRMNRIMMILTIVSTVFIPLTFIAGVYGMNFTYMPELEWKYGYFVVLGFMAFIVIGMLSWFGYKAGLGFLRIKYTKWCFYKKIGYSSEILFD